MFNRRHREYARGEDSRRFGSAGAFALAATLLALAVAFIGPSAASSAPNAPAAAAAIPSAFLTIIDQSGANDLPGQGDLTQMGRDDSDPSVYRIWSWDDTASWISSGNTAAYPGTPSNASEVDRCQNPIRRIVWHNRPKATR